MFKSSHLPMGDRFEKPLANLLNEQHRTMKELLEQLKMKKSSAKQQQEVERVKPQREKVHQTRGRREEDSGWGTHVYLWWIHFDIWQN